MGLWYREEQVGLWSSPQTREKHPSLLLFSFLPTEVQVPFLLAFICSEEPNKLEYVNLSAKLDIQVSNKSLTATPMPNVKFVTTSFAKRSVHHLLSKAIRSPRT